MAKTTNEKIIENLDEVLGDLEDLIQARITENNTVGTKQGIMHKQYTHVYMYYRSKVWEARELINKLR